jgi:hypothetical protein
MKVRPATIRDKEFIKDLYKTNPKEIGDFNLFWVWDKYIEGTSKHRYVVIDDCGFMRYGYSKKYSAYVLYEIAVVKDVKQKGVGRAFYDHLPKPAMLKCNQTNEVGNRFYEAMGMTKVGVEENKKGLKKNIWWTT